MSKPELGRRLTRFLSNDAKFRQPLRSFLDVLLEHEGKAFFFGGLLRDVMLFGPSVTPRDVDIVVDSVRTSFLEAVRTHVQRRTRFGGLHLEAKGWLFDVWSLPSTWAFREGVISGESFWNLPKTTFLNIQAVVAEVKPRRGKPRKIFSNGFFEALSTRTLDINCEENPYPHLCVVQSLLSAAKLGFSMSRRLARYVLHHGTTDGLERLVEVQLHHYGSVQAEKASLHRWLHVIRDQLASSSGLSVALPRQRRREQMQLPFTLPAEHWVG
ncbi:hypothetical protein LCGC14_1245780 [marine sediment metagenome]|uniref:Poly A polymerase head domain-containing protein n=1 Tax=marine sediment metagenome TaxID=412755 RepID=A0A0F9LRG3_9ZZZZ